MKGKPPHSYLLSLEVEEIMKKEIDLNCGVYQIRNIINEKCYAGQSIVLRARERYHWSRLKNNNHHNIYFQRAYNKHGKNNFIFEVLIYCEPFELKRYEQFFVDKYDKMGLLYNICKECVDSLKGVQFSPEAIKKMSGENHPMYGLKGKDHPSFGYKHTPESRVLMCKNRKDTHGENHPMWGKHHSPETCAKMSKNHWDSSGENHPLWGKHPSEETLKKMSQSHIGIQAGKNHPMYGKKHSPESIEKMSKAKRGENHNMWGKKRQNSTSQYIGVYYDKSRGLWATKINCNGKTKFIGRFKVELDAAKAYNIKAIEIYGDKAKLNIID